MTDLLQVLLDIKKSKAIQLTLRGERVDVFLVESNYIGRDVCH